MGRIIPPEPRDSEVARRRTPRIPTDWLGRCKLEDQPETDWRECKVVDISLLGAGVEIVGAVLYDMVGERIEVKVEPPVGRSVILDLFGVVKNQKDLVGRTKVGLEFAHLSESERVILQVVEQLKMFW